MYIYSSGKYIVSFLYQQAREILIKYKGMLLLKFLRRELTKTKGRAIVCAIT